MMTFTLPQQRISSLGGRILFDDFELLNKGSAGPLPFMLSVTGASFPSELYYMPSLESYKG